jgi:hypothetical protein
VGEVAAAILFFLPRPPLQAKAPEKEVAVHQNGQTDTSFFTATITVERHEVEVAVHQNGQTAMRKEVADSNLYECQPPLFSWLSVHSDVQPPLSQAKAVERWLRPSQWKARSGGGCSS